MKELSKSSAIVMELLQPYTKPSIYAGALEI